MKFNNPAPRLIRLVEVCAKTGLPKASIYRRIRKGDFPERVSLGGRAVAWSEDEVDKWIVNQIANRKPLPPTKSTT